MRTIWKYPLSVNDTVNLMMPIGAKPLTVQMQGQSPCMWALVDPNAKKTERVFMIFGTGHEIYNGFNLDYIGTFQLNGGVFIFHLFELLP